LIRLREPAIVSQPQGVEAIFLIFENLANSSWQLAISQTRSSQPSALAFTQIEGKCRGKKSFDKAVIRLLNVTWAFVCNKSLTPRVGVFG
jgi:hypothetical protein